MRVTQEEYDALLTRRDLLQRCIVEHGFKGGKVPEKPAGKQKGETLRLVLPFKLPTWNQLLAMGPWQRKAIRDLIHQAVVIAAKNRDFSQWDRCKYEQLLKGKKG